MPRDSRPYLTYPISYTLHPRVDMLSDRAFRAFHELNDYCRINLTDGRIAKPLAAKRWPAKVLAELVAGDGERPLLVDEGATYFLRSYAEHQWTSDDAEELRQKRVEAGRLGGQAKARNASKGVAPGVASASRKPSKRLAESESGVNQTDHGDYPGPVTQGDAGQIDGDEGITLDDLASAGIRDLGRVRVALERVVGPLSGSQAIDVARAIVELATAPVRSTEAYVEKACVNSPAEVRVQYEARKAVWP